MKKAIILFAHGARDPEWASPMRHVQTSIQNKTGAGARVELAFLEFMQPDLAASVRVLVQDGVDTFLILPMFIARGGHLKRELPEMIDSLRSTYPACQFDLSGPIGEQAAVIEAMATEAVRMAGVDLASQGV